MDDSEKILGLIREIRSMQVELDHLEQARRMYKRIAAKHSKKEDAIKHLLEPMFICDECGCTFSQSMGRVYRLNDTAPELLVCTVCNRILKNSGAVPNTYKKWFPNRYK